MKVSKTKFDLSPLFNSDNDPRMLIDRQQTDEACQAFVDKWSGRDDYLTNDTILKEALDDYEAWQSQYGTGGAEDYYFWLRTQQDENNKELLARYQQVTELARHRANQIAFFELRLAKINPEQQQLFLESEILQSYRGFLQQLFKQSAFLLSEAEEKIMNLKSDTAYEAWIRMVSAFLAKEGAEITLTDGTKAFKTFSELQELSYDNNPELRHSADNLLDDILRRHVEVAENELNAVLADKKVNDELRGYTRPDQSRHLSDNIETEAVDALVQAVSSRYDLSHRFYRLKAQLLGQASLSYAERNLRYGAIDKKYSYEQGVALVANALQKLDSEFHAIFQGFVESGAIDVYPSSGKSSGAFCVYILKSQPTYILLNYTDSLRDVTTLAHEVGHGINNELVKKQQHALHFGTSTATAEVASIFMEDYALRELVAEADDELKLTIMIEKLNDMTSSVFRQIALYRFEQELHTKFRELGYLSYEMIGEIFQRHMASYLGSAVTLDADTSLYWIYWSHIRRYFYVYSYASGLLIANYLQDAVATDPGFIAKVKEFLSAGLSQAPSQSFAKLGVDIHDMQFWQKALNKYEQLLQEAESLAKALGRY